MNTAVYQSGVKTALDMGVGSVLYKQSMDLKDPKGLVGTFGAYYTASEYLIPMFGKSLMDYLMSMDVDHDTAKLLIGSSIDTVAKYGVKTLLGHKTSWVQELVKSGVSEGVNGMFNEPPKKKSKY